VDKELKQSTQASREITVTTREVLRKSANGTLNQIIRIFLISPTGGVSVSSKEYSGGIGRHIQSSVPKSKVYDEVRNCKDM